MPDPPNAVLARAAWDAIARGDADALRALLAPDLVWHATARGAPWAGEHRGVEAILDYLARVGELADGFQGRLVDVLASAERVAVFFEVRLERGARRAELDYVLLARVAQRRFVEVWTVPLDPGALAALFGDAGA